HAAARASRWGPGPRRTGRPGRAVSAPGDGRCAHGDGDRAPRYGPTRALSPSTGRRRWRDRPPRNDRPAPPPCPAAAARRHPPGADRRARNPTAVKRVRRCAAPTPEHRAPPPRPRPPPTRTTPWAGRCSPSCDRPTAGTAWGHPAWLSAARTRHEYARAHRVAG